MELPKIYLVVAVDGRPMLAYCTQPVEIIKIDYSVEDMDQKEAALEQERVAIISCKYKTRLKDI